MAPLATEGPAQAGAGISTGTSLIDWSAVIAGALLASALSFVFLTFGTAIGLSATSPWPNSGLPAKVIASLAVFWTLAQQIGAFLAGAYVAGRLRARRHGISSDESELRDGLHGALVWALGIALGAAFALAAAGTLTRVGVEAGARTAASAATTSTDLAIDALLRPAAGATTPARADAPSADIRSEISRILASAVAGGGLSDQNRAYLSQRVAQLTGLSPQEALDRINQAVAATRSAADTVRRAAVLTGLITAASLLTSLAAAWWAAVKGGQHHDNAVPARLGVGVYRRRSPQDTQRS
jgi:hypothetical protein